MEMMKAIMEMIKGLFGRKEPEKVGKVTLTYSTERPVDGKGNDRDVWIVYKEVEI